jgi:2-hydroxychromene-2-carboxylate isomerase
MTTLEFWYEFASTYSYPAAWRIDRLAAAAGVKVVWRPLLLGPLFQKQQAMNDSPFNLVEVKGRYMWRDLERVCQAEMLPFRRPSVFPRRSLLALRLALVGARRGWIANYSRAVFAANFGQDRDIGDPAVLAGLVKAAGGDPVEDFHEADTEAIKAELRGNVAEAEAKGIFGAPSFYIPNARSPAGELFWGNDRLEQAVAWATSGR